MRVCTQKVRAALGFGGVAEGFGFLLLAWELRG